ncbi:hypothetical protein Prudu_000350 [Prunus dulcis]|uniref:Uncharacterized protein n=1 Tax=Prunus dulcis TaxID=3755 RepID=A0A4Y1QL28_PRUDU|nr:hypothetical protein Prudu_000350 [Prunus dulcis]
MGLRLPVDQRQNTTALPMHLVDVLTVGDGAQPYAETSGSNHFIVFTLVFGSGPNQNECLSNEGSLPVVLSYCLMYYASSGPLTQQCQKQVSGSQLMGRPAASPGGTSVSNFDNTTTSPLPYANSPRSSTNMMNTPSPQQQSQQQKQQQQQQQQQKLMQLPQHQQQQLLAQQQFRQSAMQD